MLLSKSHKLEMCYFSVYIRTFFNTKPILTSISKDVLPFHHNNSLIYLFRCSFGLPYIGRTNQGLDARLKHVPTKIRNFIGCKTDDPKNISSSSSCRAASMDIPDPLSPPLPIVHRLWQVFRATSSILT